MGSFSKPKQQAPIMPQVVYVPTPSVNYGAPAMPDTGQTDGDTKKIEESVRSRKLPETVFTSYRGVLEEGDWVPHRKSLLGE